VKLKPASVFGGFSKKARNGGGEMSEAEGDRSLA
jgi:hypothetical protein